MIIENNKIQIIRLDKNQGIGFAQNIGIEAIKSSGCKNLLLLDDDSVPSFDMVDELVNVLEAQRARNKKVGAIGSFYYDQDQTISPFYRIERCRFRRQPVGAFDHSKQVDFLIASGTLIPLSVLDEVGGMREDLFIDYVDIEWSYRTTQKGYSLYGAPRAKMKHQIGDKSEVIFGKTISTPNFSRQYYFSRNAVNLYLYSKLPLKWKIADLFRLVKITMLLILFSNSNLGYLRAVLRGSFDGFINRLGPID